MQTTTTPTSTPATVELTNFNPAEFAAQLNELIARGGDILVNGRQVIVDHPLCPRPVETLRNGTVTVRVLAKTGSVVAEYIKAGRTAVVEVH